MDADVQGSGLVFERGTLRVRAPEDVLRRVTVPDVMWDPRSRTWRAPAFRHDAIVRAFSAAGAPIAPAPRPGARGRFRDLPLRPYQADALLAWRLAGGRGVVELPTGAGKTRVALAAMAAAAEPALVLVPTRVLLEQWVRAIAAAHGGPVGVQGDGEHVLELVTVATYASAWRRMDVLGDRFGLLVVDEAHHFADGRRSEALEMCAAGARLGLTATMPGDAAARERLQELIGPVVFRRTVADLTGDALAEFDVVPHLVRLDAAEREEYRREYGRFRAFRRRFERLAPGASWDVFARAAAKSEEGRRAVAGLRRAREIVGLPAQKRALVARLLDQCRDRRALVFTSSNQAAYRLSRELLLPAITCDIGREERGAILERFRAGAYRALVSARVLNEGLDVPEADVGIVAGGALGADEHVQRVGRLLRPGPGKRAVVHELVVAETMECRQWLHRNRRLRERGDDPPAGAGAPVAAGRAAER